MEVSLTRIAGGLIALILLLIVCCPPAMAQVSRLENSTSWDYRAVRINYGGGAPANAVPVAPLTASYNWGYGLSALGVNLQVPGQNQYYAACGTYSNGQLDILDAIGPFTTPVRWQSGRYHLAAGLPEGRVCVWLTAPGAFPSRLILAGDYVRGTAFFVDAIPPQPPSTDWGSWNVKLIYERAAGSRMLSFVRHNGNGRLLESFNDTPLPGDITAIDFVDYPITGGTVPYLLLSLQINDRVINGEPYTTHYAAFYRPNQGWIVQTLRNGALGNAGAKVTNDGGIGGLFGMDNSSADSFSGSLQIVTTTVDNGQIFSSTGAQAELPSSYENLNFQLAHSALSRMPLAVVSDGTDIQLGYRVERTGNRFEYRFFPVYRGEIYSDGGALRANYPVFGLALASHWSSGWPEVFWIQQDTAGTGFPALYRMAYEP